MKQLLVFLLLLCAASVSAQDVIVKKDGSTVVCRVVELTATEITYKKWSDLNGSNYVMERSAASAINYESGKKVNLSEVENLYKPGNQNDGVQQYNDQALLRMDYAANSKSLETAKVLKLIGWTGGIALTGFGLVYGVLLDGDTEQTTTGTMILAGGIVWGAGFLIPAYAMERKARNLLSINLYHQEFTLSNKTCITAGIDLLRDKTLGQNTLGLGLRYNF